VHFFVAEEREREDVRSFGTVVCFRAEIHPHHPTSMSFSMRFAAAHFLTVTAREKLWIVVIRGDDDEATEAAAVLNSESGGCVRARNCGLPPHYKHARKGLFFAPLFFFPLILFFNSSQYEMTKQQHLLVALFVSWNSGACKRPSKYLSFGTYYCCSFFVPYRSLLETHLLMSFRS
jgi:hypothetical protein